MTDKLEIYHTVNYPYLLLIFVVAHYFCVFGLSNGQSIVLKNLTASRSTYREIQTFLFQTIYIEESRQIATHLKQ